MRVLKTHPRMMSRLAVPTMIKCFMAVVLFVMTLAKQSRCCCKLLLPCVIVSSLFKWWWL